jgi:hypothetical protein
MENNMESEVSKMSNLGQGIAERAEARAETKINTIYYEYV